MPDQHIDKVGTMRGLYIKNVRVRDAGSYGCSITGLPGHPVEDVHVSNVSIHHKGGQPHIDIPADEKAAEYPEATMWGPLPAKGFFVRHARSVSFDSVDIHTTEADARPEYVNIDVE